MACDRVGVIGRECTRSQDGSLAPSEGVKHLPAGRIQHPDGLVVVEWCCQEPGGVGREGRRRHVAPSKLHLEAIDLLATILRDGAGPLPVYHLDIGGEELRHALLPEAALEDPHGVGMSVGLLRPLDGGVIGEPYEGPNDLVAPLGLIHEAQLQLGKRRGRFYRCPPPIIGLRGLCNTPGKGCYPC